MTEVLDAGLPKNVTEGSNREQFFAQLDTLALKEKATLLELCREIRIKLLKVPGLLEGNKDMGLSSTLLDVLDKILDEPTKTESEPAQIPLEVTMAAIQDGLPPAFWNFAKEHIKAAIEIALSSEAGETKQTSPNTFKAQELGIPKDKIQYVRGTKELEITLKLIPVKDEKVKDNKAKVVEENRTLEIVVTRLLA